MQVVDLLPRKYGVDTQQCLILVRSMRVKTCGFYLLGFAIIH
jgi:hypothetical protein